MRLWLLFLLTGAALVCLPALSFAATIGQESGGGVVYYVDASGKHGIIVARSDMKGHSPGCSEGLFTWSDAQSEYSGETVPLILEESVPPNSGWI